MNLVKHRQIPRFACALSIVYSFLNRSIINMLNNRCHSISNFVAATHFAVAAASLFFFSGCGPAASVYHEGGFSEEQKVAGQKEYQTVEDEESQGSNKKKLKPNR